MGVHSVSVRMNGALLPERVCHSMLGVPEVPSKRVDMRGRNAGDEKKSSQAVVCSDRAGGEPDSIRLPSNFRLSDA